MAACGFAATSTTLLIFKQHPNLLLATLIALAAILDYHLQWLSVNNLKEVWELYTSKYKYWLVLASLLGLAFLYILDVVQLLFLGHLCVIALAYGYGLPLGPLKIPTLRNVNYLKIFLIVYVWVALTVWLPLIGKGVSLKMLALESVERALFYLALTLPFDIRDEKSDKAQRLKTVANKLGDSKTKSLSVLCLISSMLITGLYYENFIFYAVVGSHSICLILVLKAKKSSPFLYYTLLMDGTIVIQYLFILTLSTIL